ncbi:Ras protein-specific guanine nucleotide-releasing factor [Orbilia ellipsospora]|uniref:Ras protein-specific guanine nucleotide-releasing factor n=1 Tax=Orbilia ellipsospora TaxID=2528407 RepID=A0AAV9WTY5_9PEZI
MMEAVIQPRHSILIHHNYHRSSVPDIRTRSTSKTSNAKKSSILRPGWLWGNRKRNNDNSKAKVPSPHVRSSSVTKSCSTEHKSETTCTADFQNAYSIPLSIRPGYEDFTASITKSLDLAHINISNAPSLDSSETFSNTPQDPAMAPSSTIFSKILGSSSREKATSSPQQQPQNKEFELQPRLSFTDRRKLNSKELRLELSRGFDDAGCDMKRSGSFRRSSVVSRTSRSLRYSQDQSSRYSQDQSSRAEEVPSKEVNHGKQVPKAPSTPLHSSVVHNVSTYLSNFGLLTPPSSLRKQREEKERAKEVQHELKKLSIKHLTPPRTPSKPRQSASQSISDQAIPETPKSPISLQYHTRRLSSSSSSKSSESSNNDKGGLFDEGFIPTDLSPTLSRISTRNNEQDNYTTDKLFENPRQLLQPLPGQGRQSLDQARGKNMDLPLAQLASFTEPTFANPSQTTYDIRDMVLPVVTIANALGFPRKASVHTQVADKFVKLKSPPKVQSKNQENNPNNSMVGTFKAKSGLAAFQRRSSVKVPTRINSLEKNSPYSHSNSNSYRAPSSHRNQTYTEESRFSVASEASSMENIQHFCPVPTPSAPISAFDDDSSDDDYFGDLKHLSGLGTRNLRRRKTNSKRFSRESTTLTTDRPFSRMSFSKQDTPINSKDLENGRTSTESFIPVRQIPIPEEAQLSTSAGTFNNTRFGSSRLIRDNEVHHLKDGEGFDHLVLEQEEGKNLVVSGTIDCLIMELCTSFETGDDETFADVFLRTYLLFSSPSSLLRSLTSHFRSSNSRVQERTLLVLERWLRTQPEDVFETEVTREALLMFLAEVSCWGHTQQAVRLTQTYSQMKEKLQAFWVAAKEAKDSKDILGGSIPSFPDNLRLFFGDESVMMEVAQYLTAVDLVLFRDGSHIRTMVLWWSSQTNEEQSNWSWDTEVPYISNKFGDGDAERVNRLLRRTADFKFWIQYEVLSMTKIEDRAGLISSLIHLAAVFKEQGNFHSCLVIIDALAANTIISLENTWQHVPIGNIREFSDLRLLLDQRAYSSLVSQLKDFTIPYFPFFVKSVATILNQSTNASSRYSDASKIHVDSQIETTLYRPSPPSPNDKSTNPLPILLDFKKYRAFVKEVYLYRSLTRYPPSFVWALNRKCFVFRLMEIGRTTFPRDRDAASRATSRLRSGSITSIPEETPDANYLSQFSEIIESRVEAVLAPIIQATIEGSTTVFQQFTSKSVRLREQIDNEDSPILD